MITQAVDASYAFYGASSFKYSLSSWSGNVATLPQKDMFRDAIAFQALLFARVATMAQLLHVRVAILYYQMHPFTMPSSIAFRRTRFTDCA